MSSIWGTNLKVSLFGESHSSGIGCVIDGLPSGIELDIDAVKKDVLRRSAKSYNLATPRKEDDDFIILSGFFNGRTTGTPLSFIIENKNTKSKDYKPNILRPGHADYTAYKRYKGYQDYRGGGHFSGRLTAPLVIAGAVAKQVLKSLINDINIGSRIVSINSIEDVKIKNHTEYYDLDLSDKKYPVINDDIIDKFEEKVKEANKNKDSVGGIIETWITGLPAGIGDPFFNSIESELSSLIFSIPAVKGLEFGLGFEFAQKTGFETNDSFVFENGEIKTETNNNGGINGGISNGQPIVFRAVIKPTATISKQQKTIDYETKENIICEYGGRHDPCIVLRAPVVFESVTALGILNLVLGSYLFS